MEREPPACPLPAMSWEMTTVGRAMARHSVRLDGHCVFPVESGNLQAEAHRLVQMCVHRVADF